MCNKFTNCFELLLVRDIDSRKVTRIGIKLPRCEFQLSYYLSQLGANYLTFPSLIHFSVKLGKQYLIAYCYEGVSYILVLNECQWNLNHDVDGSIMIMKKSFFCAFGKYEELQQASIFSGLLLNLLSMDKMAIQTESSCLYKLLLSYGLS